MSDILHIEDTLDTFNVDTIPNINIDTYIRKSIKINIDPVRYKQLHKLKPLDVCITPVDSEMTIKNIHDSNSLRFNLCSSVFDSGFNSKQVSGIELIKNYDGSVDFVIKFSGKHSQKNKKCSVTGKKRKMVQKKMPVVQDL